MGRGLFFMPLVVGLVVGLLPASAAPLHEAAKTGEVEKAERLIQAGADLEAPTWKRWTRRGKRP